MSSGKANLFQKYDIPAPRYTSYPTVPYWSDSPTTEQWIQSLHQAFESPQSTWSIYLHLPFCESLCTFCGCNTVITKNHDVENPYVVSLLKEWGFYLNQVEALRTRPLRQLHLGGGTPTFLSVENLSRLLEPIFSQVTVDPNHFDGSVEVDPRRTNRTQLERLYQFGFKRISLGVQDFDPEVQRLVNRIQPAEITEKITMESREIGYDSVNFDLIYGLPKQNLKSFEKTAHLTVKMRPDRIALYSFALVPWIKKVQRIFKDEDLPSGEEKRKLYELARSILLSNGYIEIGMDHFALPSDELAKSQTRGTLHRNFMGYTETRTDVLLGMGLSSISESPTCFHQNEKVLPVYERLIESGKIPTFRGHRLTKEDQVHREQILTLMTQFRVEFLNDGQKKSVETFCGELIADGCARIEGNSLVVTDVGRPFLRNLCMGFDVRLREKMPDTRVFSQSL
jgi:oxygen-independent coproporphyrinogen III oxidase